MTPRQKQCLDFITRYYREHGYSPSYVEISEGVNVASRSSVFRLVKELVAQGELKERRGHARSLAPMEIIEADRLRRIADRVRDGLQPEPPTLAGAVQALRDIAAIIEGEA